VTVGICRCAQAANAPVLLWLRPATAVGGLPCDCPCAAGGLAVHGLGVGLLGEGVIMQP
jgi:hypothetical protein